jgi:predicted AAA+ superfamily ATPase
MEDPELMELIKKTAEKHQVILLIAPQGTGKSYYFQNIEDPSIIISPTRALANQYFSVSVRDRYGRLIALPNTFFQSVEHIKEHRDNTDLLVIDEVHKIVQYSSCVWYDIS